jgi:hypothetical protein
MVLAGCGTTTSKGVAQGRASSQGAAENKDYEQILKGRHNLREYVTGKWKMRIWIDGTLYRPGEPIRVTLDFEVPDWGGRDNPEVELGCGICPVGRNDRVATAKYDVKLTRLQTYPYVWTGTVANVFPTGPGSRQSRIKERGVTSSVAM